MLGSYFSLGSYINPSFLPNSNLRPFAIFKRNVLFFFFKKNVPRNPISNLVSILYQKNPDTLKEFHEIQISDLENSSSVVMKSFCKHQSSFMPTKPFPSHRSSGTISLWFSNG